ncbi:hypothetical protein FZC84_21120 [Rossellomorea vietnamensis]|uniref:Uncharacterized protein n=1 Tax=Rossellomorea vietnamensis TaxID=218284 RepID=A0A5D4M224_9BACI|nr:hypothetical protein [Rossellomorea vietnamensis]TYR95696.1 hypothetical protein FZC84_21120 [Rossellomorea vietnamensis]
MIKIIRYKHAWGKQYDFDLLVDGEHRTVRMWGVDGGKGNVFILFYGPRPDKEGFEEDNAIQDAINEHMQFWLLLADFSPSEVFE